MSALGQNRRDAQKQERASLFEGRSHLRTQLIQAVNGNPISAEDSWTLLHRWDALFEALVDARHALMHLDPRPFAGDEALDPHDQWTRHVIAAGLGHEPHPCIDGAACPLVDEAWTAE